MKALKSFAKKSNKQERERKVLLGLVEQYIQTGKPVGSHTLKEVGFADLSSATIRNYFSHLEEEGYLVQQHSSGGRIPTYKAYRLYAQECIESPKSLSPDYDKVFAVLSSTETREIAFFLQRAAEELAGITKTAIFLSAPNFEQDYIIGIKIMAIDSTRCLCALITDFGDIRTEILYVPHKLSAFTLKRIEEYFNWRPHSLAQSKPQLNKEEEDLAQELYKELMLRYIVSYSHFSDSEIYRTGFSHLLAYPEFHDPATLSDSLSLFENTHSMQLLLKECSKLDALKLWIGEELNIHAPHPLPQCSILAMPYHVNRQPVGAIGILGPVRMPYGTHLNILRNYSLSISAALTRNLYKYKITMRQPQNEPKERKLLAEIRRPLLVHNAPREQART